MTADTVLATIGDGIAVLTLNRPQRRNAWNRELGAHLGEHLRRCDGDQAVRVIVLTGAGAGFCAGADLSGGPETFAAPDSGFSATPLDPLLFRLRKPVIAAVNGHALGIGLTLALQADIRLVADDADYGIVQVRWGVVGDMMAHWLLPRIAGASVAADLLLTGRTFDGPRAVQMGLASRSLPAPDVLPAALEVAGTIAADCVPASVELSKSLLWQGLARSADPDQVAAAETIAHRRVMGSPDTAEAMLARRQNRPARWSAPPAKLAGGLWDGA